MSTITGKTNFKSCRIYVDGILHLEFILENHDGIQSWLDNINTESPKFYIELYRKIGNPIRLEYAKKELWVSILEELDKLV